MNYNFFVSSSMVMINMLALMSDNTMMLWILMEFNNFLLVFYLWNHALESQKHLILKFFIVQSISSFIIIFCFFNNLMFKHVFLKEALLLALFMKMGLFPFQIWSVMLIEYIDLKNFFFFLNLSKIIPMIMIFQISSKSMIFLTLLSINSLGVIYYAMNLKSLKMLLLISSISALTMLFLITNYELFMISNLAYTFFMSIFFSILNLLLKNKNDFKIMESFNFSKLALFMFLMFSISGIPPLFMFWVKVSILSELTNNLVFLIFIFNTWVMFYMYFSFTLNFLPTLTNKNYVLIYNQKMNFFVYLTFFFLLLISLTYALFMVN